MITIKERIKNFLLVIDGVMQTDESRRERLFKFYFDSLFSLRENVLRLGKLEQKYLIGGCNQW